MMTRQDAMKFHITSARLLPAHKGARFPVVLCGGHTVWSETVPLNARNWPSDTKICPACLRREPEATRRVNQLG